MKILHPIPNDTSMWGAFTCIQETEWESMISIVNKTSLDYALHGNPKYLLNEIGPYPEGQLRKVLPIYRECQYKKTCGLYNKKTCFPHKKMPNCFSPAGQFSLEQKEALDIILNAWKDNTYVIVVDEDK